jgi:hypothetical protein
VVAGVLVIARFDERGKWVEDWASWDQVGMLQQLGAIPASPPRERSANYDTLDANQGARAPRHRYNHGAADDGTEMFAGDFAAYMPGQPPLDRPTFERFASGVTNGMPGYTYEIHDQIAQGDVVANRVTWRGVHSGNLRAFRPPVGRSSCAGSICSG